jgi:hypothetical protein
MDERVMAALQRAVGDTHLTVTRAALKALAASPSSQHEALALATAEARAFLQDGLVGETLASNVWTWLASVVPSLAPLAQDELCTLLDLLDSSYWNVRASVISALQQLRPRLPDAAIDCILALRHDPESAAVRIAADDLLGGLLTLEWSIEDVD